MGQAEEQTAWQESRVESKQEVIDEARREGKTVHFATVMDLCHLTNAEMENRVVLRGDVVFTEQGSSASHTPASKVLDVISRLLGCAGEDAVSSSTPVKMGRRSRIVGIARIRMSNDLDPLAENAPPKIVGQYSRSRGTLERFVRTPFVRIAM